MLKRIALVVGILGSCTFREVVQRTLNDLCAPTMLAGYGQDMDQVESYLLVGSQQQFEDGACFGRLVTKHRLNRIRDIGAAVIEQ